MEGGVSVRKKKCNLYYVDLLVGFVNAEYSSKYHRTKHEKPSGITHLYTIKKIYIRKKLWYNSNKDRPQKRGFV